MMDKLRLAGLRRIEKERPAFQVDTGKPWMEYVGANYAIILVERLDGSVFNFVPLKPRGNIIATNRF